MGCLLCYVYLQLLLIPEFGRRAGAEKIVFAAVTVSPRGGGLASIPLFVLSGQGLGLRIYILDSWQERRWGSVRGCRHKSRIET